MSYTLKLMDPDMLNRDLIIMILLKKFSKNIISSHETQIHESGCFSDIMHYSQCIAVCEFVVFGSFRGSTLLSSQMSHWRKPQACQQAATLRPVHRSCKTIVRVIVHYIPLDSHVTHSSISPLPTSIVGQTQCSSITVTIPTLITHPKMLIKRDQTAPQTASAAVSTRRRFPNPPQIRPRHLLNAATSAIAALRYLPIFTPRQTLSRWRSHRAMVKAARSARSAESLGANWQKHFFLNGLTWHHLYLEQDLRRIATFLREATHRLDSATDPAAIQKALHPIIALERSLTYLADNVWLVYNTLEEEVLFPWISAAAVERRPALPHALAVFSKERTRIENATDLVQSRLARAVCNVGLSHTSQGPCRKSGSFSKMLARRRAAARRKNPPSRRGKISVALEQGSADKDEADALRKKAALQLREGYFPSEEKSDSALQAVTKLRRVNADELRGISADLWAVIEDTERLHRTERSVLYPFIAESFSQREQSRLTNVMVYSMRSVLAKFTITIYHQAVEKNGTREQWEHYRREVPLPVRAYTPVWRARLYDGSPLGWLRSTPISEVGR